MIFDDGFGVIVWYILVYKQYVFCTFIFGRSNVIHYIMVEQQNESISR